MTAPEDEDEASKTEEPSERKIAKAKEEGDVAISQDAKSFIMLIGSLFIIWLLVGQTIFFISLLMSLNCFPIRPKKFLIEPKNPTFSFLSAIRVTPYLVSL